MHSLKMGFEIYLLPVDSRIKIKSSSQVNFFSYYGSINQSTFTKFWNLKFVQIRVGTLRLKWRTAFILRFTHQYSIGRNFRGILKRTSNCDWLAQANIRKMHSNLHNIVYRLLGSAHAMGIIVIQTFIIYSNVQKGSCEDFQCENYLRITWIPLKIFWNST